MKKHSPYQLVDSGNFQKLERIGDFLISRPAAQAIWQPRYGNKEWARADAVFVRDASGGGKWTRHNKKIPESWMISLAGLRYVVRLTDFGHVGLFPEHHSWERLEKQIRSKVNDGGTFRLLNLFAYTGSVSVAASSFGAEVVHVDASKTSVSWARENAEASGVAENPVRWIVDDVQKFVAREVRRESKYHGIVLDPPSFGRGPKGNLWKIEEHLTPLMENLIQILDSEASFFQLSSHSQGMTPIALKNLMQDYFEPKGGKMESFEMTIEEVEGGRLLPAGAGCVWMK